MTTVHAIEAELRLNKNGQTIGRKGAVTRRRLIETAEQLLKANPAEPLTVAAIARKAEIAPATFYVYFADPKELLLALAEAAAEDFQPVLDILLQPWDLERIHDHVEAFICAFTSAWLKHCEVFTIRNFEADRGDERFNELRIRVGGPITEALGARVVAFRGEKPLSRADAVARAVIAYQALERVMVLHMRPPHITRGWVTEADLLRAEAAIITMLVTPQNAPAQKRKSPSRKAPARRAEAAAGPTATAPTLKTVRALKASPTLKASKALSRRPRAD